MSIAFSGRRSRSRGLISAVIKQVKLANLKPLSKITIQFDPFHDKVAETRNFGFYLSAPRILATNLDCSFKTQVVCDRSDPLIICDYEGSDEKLILKSANFNSAELLELFNKHVSSRVKVVEEDPLSLKISKKKGKKGRK